MTIKPHKDPDTETGLPKKLKKWKLWTGLATSIAVLTPFCVAGVKNAFDIWNAPEVQRVHDKQINTLEKNQFGQREDFQMMQMQITNLTEQLQEVKQLCTETRQDVRSLRYRYDMPIYTPKEKDNQQP